MGLTTLALALTSLLAADPPRAVAAPRDAVERAVGLVERAARNYPRHRQCFACHHQTLPLLTQITAQRAGLAIDQPTFDQTVKFTRDWFGTQQDRLATGQRIDGWAITVAYGLWTLEIARQPADDLSDALVANLLQTQHADGYWEPEAHRPPAEESKVFVTALSLRGLQKFGRPARREEIQRSSHRARAWMRTAPLDSIDDHVGRLLAVAGDVNRSAATRDELDALRGRILKQQRPDGGWPQRPEMSSDAYGTGLTLWSLAEAGLSVKTPEFQQGVQYLLRTQLVDGSWHVRSRCEPVQPYFDNGDPHGKDQFLSLLATGWSAAALARGL